MPSTNPPPPAAIRPLSPSAAGTGPGPTAEDALGDESTSEGDMAEGPIPGAGTGAEPDRPVPADAAGAPPGLLRRLWSRWGHQIWELMRFGAVGGMAYVVDVGLYNLLVFGPGHVMGGNPVTAKVVSVAVATLLSWVGNRYWTFSGKRAHTPVRELVWFVVVNLGGMVIAAGCLYFSRWVLDLHSQLADNISGNIIGTGLGTIFRYLCYKYLVFATPGARRRRATAEPEDDPAV